MKCKCGTEKETAVGVGEFCPNPNCNEEHLSLKELNQMVDNKCEICGTDEKSPKAKYCKDCSQMVSKEYQSLNKNLWRVAINNVKQRKKDVT